MITVWKKALKVISVKDWQWEYVILKLECDETQLLEFPEEGNKCRVPEVKVVSITTLPYDFFNPHATTVGATLRILERHGLIGAAALFGSAALKDKDARYYTWYSRHNFTNLNDGDVVSWFDHTRWVVGETIKCDKWEGPEYGQCAHGIHVFKTKELAEQYQF